MKIKSATKIGEFLLKQYSAMKTVLAVVIATGVWEVYYLYKQGWKYDPDADISSAAMASGVASLVQIILVCWIFINFLRFIYRLSKNLQEKHQIKLSVTPGWAVGYFFIPIINLYKPYQILKEILQAVYTEGIISKKLLGYWWAFWIISNAVSRGVGRIVTGDGVSYSTGTIMFLVSDILDYVTLFVEAELVRQILSAYKSKFESQAEPTPIQ